MFGRKKESPELKAFLSLTQASLSSVIPFTEIRDFISAMKYGTCNKNESGEDHYYSYEYKIFGPVIEPENCFFVFTCTKCNKIYCISEKSFNESLNKIPPSIIREYKWLINKDFSGLLFHLNTPLNAETFIKEYQRHGFINWRSLLETVFGNCEDMAHEHGRMDGSERAKVYHHVRKVILEHLDKDYPICSSENSK